MELTSTLSSEEQSQLDIMIQLGFTTLQMSRRITSLRCCVRNYVLDTMAHSSAKPTGRPRIHNDLDKRSVSMSGDFLPEQFVVTESRAVSNYRAQRCCVGQDPAIIPRVLLIAGTTDYSK
uniref:HTH_Tnp_Tc3_1 domain-containing protein n=1 Tax=Caenorhabditis japonica TaxID=281687 RepID=A0A8R1EM51_CAEJA